MPLRTDRAIEVYREAHVRLSGINFDNAQDLGWWGHYASSNTLSIENCNITTL